MNAEASRDLDETRRLLYGVLVAEKTKRWEVVGTAANALLHHQGVDKEPAELLDLLVDVVDGRETDARDWVWQQIERINAELSASDAGALDVNGDVGQQGPNE